MKNLLVVFIFAFVIANAYGRAQQKQDFSIKVGVEEVRIDAIVLDKKGNQVVDLTAGDFEVYQDGKPQQIISSIYISDAQKHDKPVASPEADKAGLLLSRPKLSKDEVRRTIAFLVGGRGYESRIAIRKFIKTQMEPGDLVTILGGGALMGAQQFSSDRKQLLYSDLTLSFSSGYAHAPATGYFVRSWMHLDGKDLTFVEGKDGEHSLLLELLSLTSDSNGRTQDTKGFRYDFQLGDADIALINKYGIDLKTYLPVQNPGHYYVSVAIKDRTSGKIGSGYQFLDIPDLRNFRLSLSSILAIYNNKDESVLRSGNLEEDVDSYNAMKKWRALSKSPALRVYRPGESFDYMMFVYNANSKDGKASKLELRSTLFKDGQIYSQETEDIDLKGMDGPGRIPILRRLILNTMDDGDYLLQLTVTDKLSSARTAAQAIDFQIRKE
jgi:hypothetical protein